MFANRVSRTKKQVYVVSEFVDQKTNSTGYFWCKIIYGISRRLENVNVISTYKSCLLAMPDNKSVSYFPTKQIAIQTKKGFINKLVDNIFLSWRFLTKILPVVRKGDIVVCGTNPSMMVLLLALIKPIIKFKWVFVVNDVFPENLVPAKLISSNSILYKTTKKFFDRAYSRADKIIVIGRDMWDLVHCKTQGKVSIEYIPNWIDQSDLESGSALSSDSKFKVASNEKLLFQFFGNLGVAQGLESLLAGIAGIQSRKVKFRFVGGGSASELIEQFVQNNPHIDIELLPPVQFSENMATLKDCDIALVCLAPGMKGLAVPSKAYFSMAVDKPILVIGDIGSELDLLVRENPRIGWFCDCRDKFSIAETIDEIAEVDLSKLEGYPKEVIESFYNFQSASDRYVDIIEGMCE